MRFLTGSHLPRRTFLEGAGATLALPFLDAMVPVSPWTRRVSAAADVTRLVCIEEVHGLAGCNGHGAARFLFAPETTGRFELVRTRYSRQASETWASMSSFVEKAVAR